MRIEEFIKRHKSTFKNKEMHETYDAEFEDMLKLELHSTKSSNKRTITYLSIAASLIFIISLGYVYNRSIKEKIETRNQLVLALDGETASERLDAIYEIEETYKQEDKDLLSALYKMLLEDTNTNVKLAAIDFLLKFPNNQEMRLQLIKALKQEKVPLIQLKLIESLASLREQRAKQPLRDILNNDEVLPSVKGSASASLALLNQ